MTTTTSATTGAAGVPSTPAPGVSKANQEYNSELFMKLLVTQLSNQDPSSPMDSSQMVAQTAQLASMEQLTSLNKTTTGNYQAQMQSTATSMLGKSVSWTDSNGTAQTGKVASIAFSSTGTPQLTVGSSTIALTAVTGVTAP
jgi:flagellar basal-body rod modification protein FlgD